MAEKKFPTPAMEEHSVEKEDQEYSLCYLFEPEWGALCGGSELAKGDGVRKNSGPDPTGLSRPLKALWLLPRVKAGAAEEGRDLA